MEFQIQTKNCASCGKQFKVGVRSKQRFCSLYCNEVGSKWADQEQASSDERSTIESVSVDNGRLMQSSENARKNDKKHTGWHIPTKKKIEADATMSKTKSAEIEDETNGQKKIAITKTLSKENGTEQTAHSSGLSPQSQSTNEEIYHSMSLIKESVLLLKDHMNSVKTDPDGEVALSSKIEKVNMACKCAGEIAKLLKVQVEAAKLFR